MVDKFEFFIDIFKAMKAIQQKMDSGFRLNIKWREGKLSYCASLKIKPDEEMIKENAIDYHVGGGSPTLIGCLLNLYYQFKEDEK